MAEHDVELVADERDTDLIDEAEACREIGGNKPMPRKQVLRHLF